MKNNASILPEINKLNIESALCLVGRLVSEVNMKNKEKAEDILQHIAEGYNTTPKRVRQILDEIIDRVWSEKGREAGESRLELFSEKPTAEEFLGGVLDGTDNDL